MLRSETHHTLVFKQRTRSIEVSVAPKYMEDQSRPGENLFVWAYQVEIHNGSDYSLQLRKRHWRVCSGSGQFLEIKGDGVVGVQPTIEAGETYRYSSYTNLSTPSGMMYGSYQMQTEQGELIEVAIPAFSLDSPDQLSMPN